MKSIINSQVKNTEVIQIEGTNKDK